MRAHQVMTKNVITVTPSTAVLDAANIMLREHFRCVPAIIAYSNRAHYGGQIQPM